MYGKVRRRDSTLVGGRPLVVDRWRQPASVAGRVLQANTLNYDEPRRDGQK